MGCLDHVFGDHEWNAGQFRKILAGQRRITFWRIELGANRGAANVDFTKQRNHVTKTVFVFHGHSGKGGELHTKSHRHGILQLGATHLDDVLKLLGLAAECTAQMSHRGDQFAQLKNQRNLERGWVNVICRLRHVHVIERVAVHVVALFVTHQLESSVGDYLVGVHVGAGARPTLNGVDDELRIEFALGHFATGRDNGITDARLELADRTVCLGRRLLNQRKRTDQASVVPDGHPGDWKVFGRSSGMNAPVGVARHFEIAEKVMF